MRFVRVKNQTFYTEDDQSFYYDDYYNKWYKIANIDYVRAFS